MRNISSAIVGGRITGPGTPRDPTRRIHTVTSGYKLEPQYKPGKYDHAQMLRDRIDGMTWSQIAEKHGIPSSGKNTAAHQARRFALHSAAARRLTPAEAAAVDGIK